MTPVQRRMRAAFDALHPASPQRLTESFTELLDHIHSRLLASHLIRLRLHTDRKLEYVRALSAHAGLKEATRRGAFTHHRTDSRAARVRSNPLFPVNYVDRQLRTDLAEHVRETVRFARNVNHSMERLWVYLLDHNLHKRFRINDPARVRRSHADEAGASGATQRQATRSLLTRRRFLSFETLEPALERVWRREHPTPLKGILKGALKQIRRQASKGEVDLEQIREQLGVASLVVATPQYLPKYALN
mgnify:FL=1